MRESLFETLVGLAVVIVAGFFLVYSLSQRSDAATGDSYQLLAKFPRADAIAPGTDVRVAGVKVGSVTDVKVNPETLRAEVKMTVSRSLSMPLDSTAKIQADGLLGGNYVFIEPGGDPENMPTDGTGVFEYTSGSVDILRLLIDAVSAAGGGGDGVNDSGANAEGATP
jgi:phospholipid/cholesterol/gamma-HCH transport system substrate-binding protein